MIVMSLYRTASILVTMVCVLYMCLVSVLHLGLQVRDWQIQGRNYIQQVSSQDQHLQLQKRTRGEQRSPAGQSLVDKYSLSRTVLEIHQRKHPHNSSFSDQRKHPRNSSFSDQRKHPLNSSFSDQRKHPHNSSFSDQRKHPLNSSFSEQRKHPLNSLFSEQRKHPRNSSDRNTFGIEKNTSKTSTNTSGIDKPTVEEHPSENNQQLTMRKLQENTSQHATNPSQRYTPPQASSMNVNISQIKVDFVFLRGIYIYGIFLDKRYPKGEFIRFLTVQPTRSPTPQLMCQFRDARDRGINVKAEPYEMCENHGRKYGGWIYSCPVPQSTGGATLLTVSLLAVTEDLIVLDGLEPVALQALNMLKKRDQVSAQIVDSRSQIQKASRKFGNISQASVTNRQQASYFLDKEILKLGVCVPPLHGDISLTKIINFIEMCRVLGADKVFLYIHDIPKDILAFLKNYTGSSPNILSLVLWDLPIIDKNAQPTEANQIIWNRGQLPAVQHCLYTNMPQFDWLLFIDIDEMLIPQKSTTWPELFSEVTGQFNIQFQGRPFAGISFESAFFQQDFQTQATNSIEYFQYLHRTKATSLQRSKLFVQPFQVFELGIHHLSRGVSRDAAVIRVGVQQALLHHYRKCVPDYNSASLLHCEMLVKDDTILRYEAPMTAASREVIAGAMEFLASYT